jgi:hypothetical protein
MSVHNSSHPYVATLEGLNHTLTIKPSIVKNQLVSPATNKRLPTGLAQQIKYSIITFFISLTMYSTAHAGMVSFIDNPQGKCPKGWTEVSASKGRLIRGTINGSEVGKTQGTPMKDQTSPTHHHDFKIGVKLKFEPVVAISGCCNRSITGSNTEYKASDTTKESDWNLPYMQLLVCEQHSGIPAEKVMPNEMVAFFNDQKCPEQWEPYKKLNHRFAVPLPADAKEGDFNALVDPGLGGDLNHVHPIKVVDDKSVVQGNTVRISIPSQSLVLIKPIGAFLRNSNYGNSTVPDSDYKSGQGNTIVPYINFLACRKTAGRNRTSQLPESMLGFITAEHCPNKWAQKSESMGRFLVGLPSGQYAYSGVTFGSGPLKSKEIRQHSHDLETKIKLPVVSITGANGCCAHYYARAGEYSMRGKTALSPSTLPYVQMRHCVIPTRASPGTSGGRIQQ